MNIISLILAIPSIIGTLIKIYSRLSKLESPDFWEVLLAVGDIITLLIGLGPSEKKESKTILELVPDAVGEADSKLRKSKLETLKNMAAERCILNGCREDTLKGPRF